MACFHPLDAYRRIFKDGTKGKPVFKLPRPPFEDLQLPCGQCIGCRLEYSRQWAMRCVHEASLYEDNCFITLTYDNEHLPETGSLVKADFQKFMKRLRKMFPSQTIRYYQCGEYGEQFGRPHYHACLFNFDFPDKVFFKDAGGYPLFISSILEKLWPFGFSTIGAVTFETAAYTARYIMKKITGDEAKDHYERIDLTTGEVIDLQPEYTTMSRRPGIAHDWYDQFKDDVFPDDTVIMRGREMSPPRYYEKILEIEDPEEYKRIKEKRMLEISRHAENCTPERLAVREKVQKAKLGFLPRPVD